MVMFGATTLGSILWGELASLISFPVAHYVVAACALVTIPLLRAYRLQTGADLDLTPSMHWPVPVLFNDIGDDHGPVLITVEYRIAAKDWEPFLAALRYVAAERKRDGAYRWGVFEDAAEEGRWAETFLVDSWLEDLRQHERVSNADRARQAAVHRFHTVGSPKVTHYIAAEVAPTTSSPKRQE